MLHGPHRRVVFRRGDHSVGADDLRRHHARRLLTYGPGSELRAAAAAAARYP